MKHQSIKVLLVFVFFAVTSQVASQTLIRGTILDSKTEEPIVEAKFGVSSQGIGVFSNAEGKFTYRKYHHVVNDDSEFMVSAPGYRNFKRSIDVLRRLQNKRGIIYLEKSTDEIAETKAISEKIMVLWDASEKSRSRNPERELSYLNQYLSNTQAKEVVVRAFNETILIDKTFPISEFTFEAIQKLIKNIDYTGVSDHGLIANYQADEVLLFTESKPTFGTIEVDQNTPVYIVNSSRDASSDVYFEKLSKYTSGSYKKLNKSRVSVSPVEKGPFVTGQYIKGETPVPYAVISKKGVLKEYTTDAEGYFKIPATDGDELTFYSLGNFPKTLRVTSKTQYTVMAISKAEQLAEVNLKTKRKRSEYAFDSILQLDMVEGREVPIRSVHKSQFNRNAFTIGDAIDGIYGAKSFYNAAKGQTYITVGGGCARVFVDGDEMSADAIPVHLVENISIYQSYSMVLPCPSRIIVTTRMHKDRIDQRLRKAGYEQLKNNVYKEEVAVLETEKSEVGYFQKNTITGVVRGNGTVLQGASILRRGTLEEVITDANGAFSIKVADGDILDIKHFGMYPKSLVVTDKKKYTIELITKAEILDEVAVKAEKEEEEETIVTGYGQKDKKAVGYQVEDKLSEFISPADISFDQVALKIPGVIVDPTTKQLFFQRSFGALNKSPIMIVVDDITVSQTIVSTIDPQTITNITALKGVAATNRYGSQAFGGVLLIETLHNSFTENQGTPDLTIKNNIYDEALPTLSFDAVNEDYIDDVASKQSIKIKLEKYRSLKKLYRDKVDFYVDMALFFQALDAGAAREVRNDFALLAKDNIKALRILAYLNEHAREFIQAQKVYVRILEMAPNEPQSYRDLAMIYQETGEYNRALELYINMLGNRVPGVDFSSLSQVISNELQRLINLHKHKIEYQRLTNDWLVANFNIDVRMTASWSDSNAPFEFQFVNPSKRFYNWNSDNIREQNKKIDKTTEEFVIDDAQSGKWLVNVRYTGDENSSNIPPYLKYTLYKDFGTPNEEKQIKVVKLDNQIRKVTLDSFVY